MIVSDVPRATAARSPAFRPLFRCSWERVVFLHYDVDPEILQAQVPFPLDLHEGRAYVSLVAFTLRDLRFSRGGPPLTTHGFLNVRTYVTVRGEPGIFFLAEWLSNPLCVLFGPRLYGLPYRFGSLDYRHAPEAGRLQGRVRASDGELRYDAAPDRAPALSPCAPESLEEFLLERYTAFTAWRGLTRLLRVRHPKWAKTPLDATIERSDLMASTGAWFPRATPCGAHYSPGLDDVLMGRPERSP